MTNNIQPARNHQGHATADETQTHRKQPATSNGWYQPTNNDQLIQLTSSLALAIFLPTLGSASTFALVFAALSSLLPLDTWAQPQLQGWAQVIEFKQEGSYDQL